MERLWKDFKTHEKAQRPQDDLRKELPLGGQVARRCLLQGLSRRAYGFESSPSLFPVEHLQLVYHLWPELTLMSPLLALLTVE